MLFDYIDMQIDNKMRQTQYGVIQGEKNCNTVVYIKMGLGSKNPAGFENKYLMMAHRLKDNFGVTVIVSTTPHMDINYITMDMQYIHSQIDSMKIKNPIIKFVGISAGAIIGLFGIEKYPEIRQALYVNMPININKSNTIKKKVDYLGELGVKQTLVYGERDSSYFISKLLFDNSLNEYVKYIEVKNADHNFSGELNEKSFIKLPELLFHEERPNLEKMIIADYEYMNRCINYLLNMFPQSKKLSEREIIINTDSINIYLKLYYLENIFMIDMETSIAALHLDFQALMLLQEYTDKYSNKETNNIEKRHFINEHTNLCIRYIIKNADKNSLLDIILNNDILPIEKDDLMIRDTILMSMDFQKTMRNNEVFLKEDSYETFEDYGIDINANLHYEDENAFLPFDFIKYLNEKYSN